MKESKIKLYKRAGKPLDWKFFIPILLLIGIVPLITYGHVIELDEVEKLVWKAGENSIDFFSYYKAVFFSVLSYLAAISLLMLKATGIYEIKKTKYLLPLVVYSVGVLLSFLLSDYKVVSSRGFPDMHQGVWVLMGYAIILYVIQSLVHHEDHVRLISYAYIFSATIIGTIGVLQYFGFDLFKSSFGKLLMLPESIHYLAEGLKFNFSEHTIYSTLFNTNYVGSFASLMVPFSMALFLNNKDKHKGYFLFLFYMLMVATWIGSNSRAGYLGVSVGLVLFVILYRRRIKLDYKKLISMFVGFIVIFALMNYSSNGRALSQFSKLSPINEGNRLEQINEKDVRIKDIILEKDYASIVTEFEVLNLRFIDNKLSFYDENLEVLEFSTKDGENIKIEDDKYKGYEIELDKEHRRVVINSYNKKIPLYFTPDGFRMAAQGGVLVKPEDPDYLKIFEGREKFASSRGYIWSRSVPMLKGTLLVGYGPDTYPIEFPQHDYVGKLNSFSSYGTIVDKPHNMYLQIGINTGVVSLLALLLVFALYIYDSLKLYFNIDIDGYLDFMGIGIFVGILSYLTAGIFNDQIISVAPLFYTMLGLGIAVNRIIESKMKPA